MQTRSRTVEMPSGLSLPLAFGMNTRLIGSGRYVSSLSASASSASHRSTPYASMSAKSCPSIPGAAPASAGASSCWSGTGHRHNLDVARHDQNELPGIMQGMKIANADVLVLSACVQMPSLAVVPKVEALTGKPVVTASIATAYALLRLLNLEPVVPGAGALLSGAY